MGIFDFLNKNKHKGNIADKERDNSYLKEVKALVNNYSKLSSEIVGCSENQINNLEQKLNLKLPNAYKEFLRWMGVKGGLLLRGSDVYYGYLIGSVWNSPEASMLNHAIELLNEYKFDGEQLLKDSIVIMSHQGTAIQYIKANDGHNPPVYMFAEQGKWLNDGPSKWANSYSEYLLNTFKEEIKAWKKLGYLKD